MQGELKKGNKPATVNRYVAEIRSLLRMTRDEWQWIDTLDFLDEPALVFGKCKVPKLLMKSLRRHPWRTFVLKGAPPAGKSLSKYSAMDCN